MTTAISLDAKTGCHGKINQTAWPYEKREIVRGGASRTSSQDVALPERGGGRTVKPGDQWVGNMARFLGVSWCFLGARRSLVLDGCWVGGNRLR